MAFIISYSSESSDNCSVILDFRYLVAHEDVPEEGGEGGGLGLAGALNSLNKTSLKCFKQ